MNKELTDWLRKRMTLIDEHRIQDREEDEW